MSFPRYPAYKDSGVEWLGEVPHQWEVVRLRWLCEIKKRIVGELGFDVLSITQRGIRIKDTESNDGQLSMDYSKYQLVEVGDFAMNHMDLLTGYVDISPVQGVTSPDYRVFSLRDPLRCHAKFILYLFQNGYLNKVFYPFGQGSSQLGRWRLPTEQFNDFWFPVPSFEEQSAIASFLDHETAKIDALVAEQERLIELLKEKRQAVISHAVTKGLDQSVPMKDSGVEWLGEVPAHWEVTHLKRRCTLITDGAHISPDTEGGVHFFVSTKDISDGGIDFDGALKTSPTSYEYMVKTGCQPRSGDVLFSKDGTIGRTVVVDGATEFVIASSLIIIRPDSAQLESSFLNALCQSWVIGQQVDGFVKGAGLPRLSIQNLLKVTGVFPPIDEQRQIARHLGVRDAYFRNLAQEAERTVSLLKERRTALISAAVTGQIDVRSFVPAEAVE